MRRLAVGALALAAGCGGGDRPSGAGFELRPERPGGPVGVVAEGRIVVWGLRPGSAHRLEAGGDCRRGRARGRVVADVNGTAFGRLGGLDDEPVLVRSGDAADNAVVSCGPRGRLTAAELASVGPGAAARADVSGLIQLRGGRVEGGVRTLRARAGDEVALAVRADRPVELRLSGLGIAQQVGPGLVSRFSVVVERPGTYRAVAGGRTVGRLVVDPRK